VKTIINDFKTRPYIEDEETMTREQTEQQLEFKINCDDFWNKQNDPRRDKLFRKMHPLIFLKEQLPAYVKIQNNWVFQFLSAREKQDYLQTRKPVHMQPLRANYKKYMEGLKEYTDLHPEEEVLSIQAFACHGIIHDGSQKVLLNQPNADGSYYETIEVETIIRRMAIKMTNVFFLVIFACCREGHTNAYDHNKPHKAVTAGEF